MQLFTIYGSAYNSALPTIYILLTKRKFHIFEYLTNINLQLGLNSLSVMSDSKKAFQNANKKLF